MSEASGGTDGKLGVMFERDRRPEELIPAAIACEAAGADELWVVEDLGWAGGLTAAASVLAVTERISVGIGIVPAPLRNPAVLAMELALLARLHPGRLIPGIGHGVRDWMVRVGAAPRSPLSLLTETVTVVKDLLAGRTVSIDGREVHIDGLTLVHPAEQQPPVVTGVTGPKSLEVSGRVADGTVLVEGTGPAHVAAARVHIDRGREAAGRTDHHRITVFTGVYVSDDPQQAAAVRAAKAPYLGFGEDEVFLPIGSAAQVAAGVQTLWDAGVDSVVLRPMGGDLAEQTALALAAVRPRP